MRLKIVLSLTLIMVGFTASLQYRAKDGSELLNLKKQAQEKAYIDHTDPYVFPVNICSTNIIA